MKSETFNPIFVASLTGLMLLSVLVGSVQAADSRPKVSVSEAVQQAGAPPTPTPLPEINTYTNTAQLSFLELGQPAFTLKYPGTGETYFRLPAQWALRGYNLITLHYDMSDVFNPAGTISTPTPNPLQQVDPGVSVYVNDFFAGNFLPEHGPNHIVTIPIPYQATTVENNPLNEYSIRLEYLSDNDIYCTYYGFLTIHDDSLVKLNFIQTPPVIDLATFPVPVVQNSFLPETLYLVLPDNYSESEVSIALNVAASIGKYGRANVKLSVVSAAEASPTLLAKSNAVIIGRPDRNAFLKQLYDTGNLPTQYSNGKILNPKDQAAVPPEDGVLQLVPSNYNPVYAYLIVSGNSDDGLRMAASSLNTAPIGYEGTLAIVHGGVVPTPVPPNTSSEILPFSSLGFRGQVYYGLGSSTATILFYVPRTWEVTEGAVLALNYYHSTNLDNKLTTLTIQLNNQPIGTARIDTTLQGEKQAVIPIKTQEIIPGIVNVLRVEVVSASALSCIYQPKSFWVNLRDTSFLKLPHKLRTDAATMPPLANPVFYLAYEPNVLFSLPSQPLKAELNGAANIAYFLGAFRGPEFNYSAVMDSNADLSAFTNRHIFMIGRPSTNGQIAKLNDKLPQPFVPGQDTLKSEIGTNAYRVPEGVSIGIVQVISAPWNPQLGITVVSGTTAEGVEWALQQLLDQGAVTRLNGDIFFIGRNVVKSFTSRVSGDLALGLIISEVTATQIPLEPVITNTQSAGAENISPDRYVRTTPEPAPSPYGNYLLYLLVAVGFIWAVFTAVQIARGGRRN